MKKRLSVSLISMVVLLAISVILSGCGGDKTTNEPNNPNDPKTLLIGKWSNEQANVVTEFYKDGTLVTFQGGEKVLEDTYTVEGKNDNSIVIKTQKGSTLNVVFKDKNTMESEGATLIRVTEDKNNSESTKTTNATKSPSELVIGKWTSGEASMELNKNGKVTIIENGEQNQFTYKLLAVAGSKDSIMIIITDSDGKDSSETVVFKDENTMAIGDETFKRATAGVAKDANTKAANGGAAGQETKTFSDPAYSVSFKYPASMRIDLMQNNTIQLTSKINDTYFIRCEQKFLQDSIKKGLTYEGTTKDFIKITIDNLKNNAKDAISNYKESSITVSDGSASTEAIFNAQTSSGYWKVRMQATAMNNYILVTQIWSHDKVYDNAVKELTSIMDTLAIK